MRETGRGCQPRLEREREVRGRVWLSNETGERERERAFLKIDVGGRKKVPHPTACVSVLP